MSETKRIIILGGGYAGVEAARKLEKRFRRNSSVEITLIDKNRHHILMTELHEVAGDRVDANSVMISYRKIFGARHVNVVQDKITDIDFKARVLRSETEEYAYDYLMISTGAEPADFGIPGIRENAFTLWSLEDALRIKRQTEEMFEHASREKNPETRKELLTFAVAGGGFTGVEMMGELLERRKTLCRKYEIPESDVRLVLVEALPQILNMIGEKPRRKAVRYLEKKGVEIHTGCYITGCREGELELKTKPPLKTHTVIWTAGVKGSSFAEGLPLADGKAGRKVVTATMQSPDDERVYFAGDALWFLEEEKPVPQIVEVALQTAETAAHNIAAAVTGKGTQKKFKSNLHGFMVSLGGRYAVSETAGLRLSGFFAMALKHLINLHYQFGVAGVNVCWNYLRHEILEIRERRSCIGGLAAWRTRGYWVAFLRVFIGVNWLIEGLKKVFEGWLDPTTVQGMFLNPADAATAATGTGEWAAEGGAEAAGQAVQALLSEPLGIYTWMMETFVYQAPLLFQFGIVLAEIGIGLALIGGLFTWLASVGSIGLNLMFIMAAMAGKESLWYMAASIVMLGGGGRAFGLDYWVIPWIKKWWNGTRLAQRTYLYLGDPG